MNLYTSKDLQTNLARGARIAVVGYGNQGHAHALNLRDGGADVIVGARRGGGGWKRAESDGFRPVPVADAVRGADFVAILLPDETQPGVVSGDIAPQLKPGAALVFAHGFCVAFRRVLPPVKNDVVLVAPKGQGDYVRRAYLEGSGVPCLVAVQHDASGRAFQKALSYAGLLGCLRMGAIETTFRDEAVTDLFGEQAVLCGGVPGLVKAAFETLVGRGYPPEVAYIECLHELKIITDLMVQGGIAYMRRRISRTAAWGSFLAERRIVSDELRSTMGSILEDIESGAFADEWQKETSSGTARLAEFLENETRHSIEPAGMSARSLITRSKEDDS
ncbi:MAG: ilvC [Candidatus Krumholzibacteriota bacterium]|nr:ilvC [Candidatus Krumholzibacteriota bacterium]